jgi:hypothetical protein
LTSPKVKPLSYLIENLGVSWLKGCHELSMPFDRCVVIHSDERRDFGDIELTFGGRVEYVSVLASVLFPRALFVGGLYFIAEGRIFGKSFLLRKRSMPLIFYLTSCRYNVGLRSIFEATGTQVFYLLFTFPPPVC